MVFWIKVINKLNFLIGLEFVFNFEKTEYDFQISKNRVLKRYYKNFVFLDGTVDFAVLKIIIGKNFTYQMSNYQKQNY